MPLQNSPTHAAASAIPDPMGNMSAVSIQPNSPDTLPSRKRRAGSHSSPADVPVRTDSPFKLSRVPSPSLRLSPDSSIKYTTKQLANPDKRQLAQDADKPSNGHCSQHVDKAGEWQLRQQIANRQTPGFSRQRTSSCSSPQQGGFYQEKPVERHSRRQSRPDTSSMAPQWSRKRQRDPNVTVQDRIAALRDIFGPDGPSPNFTFLDSNDESAEDEDCDDLPINRGIIKQPESRPISQSQLAAEVKGIYEGLVIVERICVGIVNAELAKPSQRSKEYVPAPTPEHVNESQFSALSALHRTLLHEHHGLFLASQNPSATRGIKDLASKYSMPARMWKHGIHNFLELLRHQLPDSLDYMLAFIYLAYQMMALLFETVPSFEDTWIECLGDLARYRMAIEDEDIRDREVWTSVAKHWYTQAAKKNCHIGRLYRKHSSEPQSLTSSWRLIPDDVSTGHLGTLARSDPLRQLSLYCRSLTANRPFTSARESIMTLFDGTELNELNATRSLSNDIYFVIAHACLLNVKVHPVLMNRVSSNYHTRSNSSNVTGNLRDRTRWTDFPVSWYNHALVWKRDVRGWATEYLAFLHYRFLTQQNLITGCTSYFLMTRYRVSATGFVFCNKWLLLLGHCMSLSMKESGAPHHHNGTGRLKSLQVDFDPNSSKHGTLGERSHRKGSERRSSWLPYYLASCRSSFKVLMLLLLLTLASPAAAMPDTPANREPVRTWYGNTPSNTLRHTFTGFAVGSLLMFTFLPAVRRTFFPDAATVFAVILAASTLTWLGYESSKPADTPVAQTLHTTEDMVILIMVSLFSLTFGAVHCVRLARASRRHQRPANVYYFGILSLADQYVLRVLVCVLFGTASLLASYRETLTPHVALMWEPALLSGSLILNAAYEGRESPIDVEAGGEN